MKKIYMRCMSLILLILCIQMPAEAASYKNTDFKRVKLSDKNSFDMYLSMFF